MTPSRFESGRGVSTVRAASGGVVLVAATLLSAGCNDISDGSLDNGPTTVSVDSVRGDVGRRGGAMIYQSYDDGDRLTDAGRIIDEGLRKFPADYYLIDLSGSMGSEVDIIRAFDFPDGSEVWAFNAAGLFRLFSPEQAISGGGTPLWSSLDRVIDFYVDDPQGKVVTVMTDGIDSYGDANPSGSDPDGIIRDAKHKGLRINMIAAGDYGYYDNYAGYDNAPQQAIADMKRIAEETGGGHYIRGEEYEEDKER